MFCKKIKVALFEYLRKVLNFILNKVILGIYYRLLFRVPGSLRTYVFRVSRSLCFDA